MLDTSVLFTLAEIAVALAGFSAIVGVLRSQKGTTAVLANAIRLQVMMESCFMVAVVALVPALLEKFEMGPELLWRAASAVFLCFAIPFEFIASRRTKNMPKMTVTRFNINSINWSLSIGADLIMFAVLINVVGGHAEALFLVALVMILVLSGNLFVQFASDTFTVPDQG